MDKILTTCTDCDYKSSCFQLLNDEELMLANESKVQVSYKKGETISKQGSFITHILYVKQGIVKAYRENEDGTNTIYSILPSGELIGLSSLFHKETYQFSVAALSDSQICAIDRKVIQQLLKENNQFAISIVKILNDEIDQLQGKMISLTLKQLQGRLADSLLYLASVVFENNTFPLIMSRKDLAEFSGMSTMSVVRTMQFFMKNNIIEEKNGNIFIRDSKALMKMTEIG